ncbi:MAG: acetyl-CoA acetyltransferase [Acidimicrobiales bacterium]|jgi:acetyl-CoA C-acetyltransferase|nr:acetyl-CoA acetyltransferase [Acidimicrobiales bacterium]
MSEPFDPRTPVLVGVGQLSNRVDRGAPPLEPADLMVEALRRAEADTGRPGVLASVDVVRVVNLLSWRYVNPAALVAERVGAHPRETGLTTMGGNYVQAVLNRSALDILEGRADLVALCGAEAWRTRTAARRTETDLGWTVQPPETAPPVVFGDDTPLSNDDEIALGLFLPVILYPMFDVALRAREGLSVEEHRRVIAELWSRFSEVAATNPHAWIRRAYSPGEIATPSAENRMVGFPYTKLMNSNNAVEQGAGLLLCAAERARELGIPRERWVFVHSGADAHDHYHMTNRADLCSSPAIRATGRSALDLAGIGVDDLAHVDLYSCFPSAVRVAARELGLGLDRQLTVTGGLTYAGGPWNNYVMHAIATMVGVLRDDPGARGLCTANGGWLTKHAMGVYSTEAPPAGRFRWADCQAEVDAGPRREGAPGHDGPVTIEAYTVVHGRDGEREKAHLATLTPDGRRAWAVSEDADLLLALETEEFVGRTATRRADAVVHVG